MDKLTFGYSAELFAEYVLTSMGYTVYTTKNGYSACDFVLEVDGKLERCQVKGTLAKDNNGRKEFEFRIKRDTKTSSSYTKEDIDCFILVGFSGDERYIFKSYDVELKKARILEGGKSFKKSLIWKG